MMITKGLVTGPWNPSAGPAAVESEREGAKTNPSVLNRMRDRDESVPPMHTEGVVAWDLAPTIDACVHHANRRLLVNSDQPGVTLVPFGAMVNVASLESRLSPLALVTAP